MSIVINNCIGPLNHAKIVRRSGEEQDREMGKKIADGEGIRMVGSVFWNAGSSSDDK